MIRGGRAWLLVLLALALVAGGASALNQAAQANSPEAVADGMREELREIRAAVEMCLATQDRIELRFQTLTRRTEELRGEVDAMEALDPRGVPADRYESYLDLVEEFNHSIPEWERQAEDLRRHAARCRGLVELHNERADSLQHFLVEAGIWEAGWLETIEEREGAGPGVEEVPSTTP